MSATIPDSKPLKAGAAGGDGKRDNTPGVIAKRIPRWRFTPPSNTALILFTLRVLINALALVLAIILTPGISLRTPDPPMSLTAALILLGVVFGVANTLVRPLAAPVDGRARNPHDGPLPVCEPVDSLRDN